MTVDERRVLVAVNAMGQYQATNHSRIARVTGLTRQRVAEATAALSYRRLLRDVSRNAAYKWVVTDAGREALRGDRT